VSFFNTKEDVMDIQITQFGKYLLSQGKFKPAYYAFYDDDVIYDGDYNDIIEGQSDISLRIKDTPRNKTQYVFHGIETEYRELVKQIKAQGGNAIAMEQKAEKHFAMSSAIGTSEHASEYAPAWEVALLHGAISGSSTYLSASSDPHQPIPQLNATVTYETKYKAVTDGFEPVVSSTTTDGIDDEETESGYQLQIDEQFLLLEVRELNSDFLRENFDIEAYEVLGEDKLVPLSFNRLGRQEESLEDISLAQHVEDDLDQYFSIFDPSYAAYWMDLLTDGEIDEKLLCRLRRNKTDNLFTDHHVDCDEVLAEVGDVGSGFVIGSEEDPGEIC
tara:strand:- start:1579 stop:2571 length:993 start_codon:yes stop_codon:yes gene_type:complete